MYSLEGTLPPHFIPTATNWDGVRFVRIATEGYSYTPSRRSVVVNFPAYPLIAACLARILGVSAADALLLVSNLSLGGALILLMLLRQSDIVDGARSSALVLGGACLLCFPTTMFFRMCYSDSLMLFLTVLAFFGMQCRWWLPSIAIIVGLATATRPVGVALLVPLGWHLWEETRSWRAFFKQGTLLLPIACWGLIEYMLFLYLAFDDPLAFAKTQQHWWQRTPESVSQYLGALATLEPIWSVYDPDSVAYWGRGMIKNPLFSLHFANPIYFVLTVGLVTYGGWKRWLNTKELLLSAGLLLIPYTMHSYQNCFLSEGRYSSIVFPAYLVMGRILAGCHWIVWVLFFGCCAFWLGAYSAYFAAWYDII